MSSDDPWYGVCDSVNGTPYQGATVLCHCPDADKYNDPEGTYDKVNCTVIEQLDHEKALSIFLFLYDLIVIAICIYWLYTFWGHREMRAYRISLRVRRPLYLLLSYAMILPWIFEEGVATIYLFWAKVEPERNDTWDGVNWWTNYDGSPVYYGRIGDQVLHFFYWFGFWAFFQLKIFKLWMLRYDYEYSKEMSNIEWKDHLGLRTVEPTSFFIRYRSILGNSFLMFFLQLVILVIILFIQIFIRLIPLLSYSPSASTVESVVILIIALSEFIFIVWLMHQIREVDDNFYLKAESRRMFVSSLLGGGAWIIGLIIASASDSLDYVWVRSGTILLFTTWICVICYFETIWVLKRIDEDWVKLRQPTSNYPHTGSPDSKSIYLSFKLGDVLQVQEGFEAMMRFLVKEFSCENLLCYVELSQYIVTWGGSPVIPQHSNGRRPNDPMGYENLQSDRDEDASMTIEQRQNMSSMQMQIDMSSMQNGGTTTTTTESKHGKNGSIADDIMKEQLAVEQFEYFENPEFEDELAHYEYIMQKYVYDSACLQINISGALRNEAQLVSPGMDSVRIIKMLNAIRAELWALMRDSFTRFRSTVEYRKLADILQNHKKFNQRFRNGQSSPRSNNPPSGDFGQVPN